MKICNMEKKETRYDIEDGGVLNAQEPVAAYACEAQAIPDDVPYAQIQDGVLQVTPDLEEDIAAAEHEGPISLDEFKTQFARWIER